MYDKTLIELLLSCSSTFHRSLFQCLLIYFICSSQQGYLPGIRALCDKYNVLLIVDEVQTGLCRTGKMLASDHGPIRPGMRIKFKYVQFYY